MNSSRSAFDIPASIAAWRHRATIRDELLNAEVFYSLREAQTLVERWRRHYNTVRPHRPLGYRPPAPEAFIPMDQRPTMH